MRFKWLLFLVLVVMFNGARAGNNFSIKTIVIDAGHGGKDPGATGPDKINEKDVALAVALKLGDYIQKAFPDVKIIYTRKTDIFVELHERAEIANKAKADLFIAIHCNATPSSTVYGTSTYVLGLHRTEANLEVAKRENSVILLEGDRDKNYEFDPNSPEGNIIMSMKQNAFLEQSIDIASKIENQYEVNGKRKSLGVKQAGFYVLYKTTMPSLLSEIGFISNPEEEKYLNSSKGQDAIANSLYRAFKDYKFEMENRQEENEAEAKNTSKDQHMVEKKDQPEPAASKEQPAANTSNQQAEATKPAGNNQKPASSQQTGDQLTTSQGQSNQSKTQATSSQQNQAASQGQQAPAKNESAAKPANATNATPGVVTTASGRTIRKPIDNSSGGGIAPVKTEEKPVASTTDNKPEKQAGEEATETKQPAKEVKPEAAQPEAAKEEKAVTSTEPKPVAKTEVKKETKASVETKAEKPVPKPLPKAPNADATSAISEQKLGSGLTFKVQLFALKIDIKKADYDRMNKNFTELSRETLDNGITRYYAGSVSNYAQIKKILNKAIEIGYTDAFVVGFKDGKRMTPNQLKAYSGN